MNVINVHGEKVKKGHAAYFRLAWQRSRRRKERIRLSYRHKTVHRRHRFYELTFKINSLTSNVIVCCKEATLFANFIFC